MKNIDDISLFLMDMDGTVYVGGEKIEGAFEMLDTLRAMGKKVCFLTNNSSRTTSEYITKLASMDIIVTADELITSNTATIHYLKKHHCSKSVYVVGTDSVIDEYASNGIIVTDQNPDIAVLTYDTSIDYKKITKLCSFLNDGAFYIATHPDMVCPSSPYPLTDVGAFILMIEGTTARLPDVVCGKPSTPMGEFVVDKFNLPPSQIAMCGDRLYTDVQFAFNNNFTSILVLSGETTMDMANQFSLDNLAKNKIDLILPSFKNLLD